MVLIIPCVHSLVLQIEKLGDTYYLLKRNVVLADTGKYICVASNEIGEAHCSAFVTVIGDLPCQLHAFWHPLALLHEQLMYMFCSREKETPQHLQCNSG